MDAKATRQIDIERAERWIVLYLAVISGERSDSIDTDRAMSSFDLDSVDAVEMALQFEKVFGVVVSAELFIQSQTSVHELAENIIRAARYPT